MSKQVHSDGKVQMAFLQAIDDPAMSQEKMASFFTRKNVNQVNKKSLLYIRDVWMRRWPKSNPPAGDPAHTVLSILEEFITIREKQSPNYRPEGLEDYSILGVGGGRRCAVAKGSAKPIDEVENETLVELFDNMRKCDQILDCGGLKPHDYIVDLCKSAGAGEIPAQQIAKDMLSKLEERKEARQNNRRMKLLRERLVQLDSKV